ncbi:HU family DNA-binding protein [Bacillus mycoides]|uniref:HU family DNA-binding protein n=1 Tax=Bacillus cereus group sp. N28 TaxID=2794593 RepID=UPI001F5B970B|nr:HU family DNA-binding protein [Bacillus cereus group sp. N28]
MQNRCKITPKVTFSDTSNIGPNRKIFTARRKSTVAWFLRTFEVQELAERNGRNPKKGEAMTILSSKLPAIKTG